MLAVTLIDSSTERRGALRHPVVVPALLSATGNEAIDVIVTDISESGCQLARSLDIVPASAIVLSFGGYAPIEAVVIWTSPAAFGLRFSAPLHPALVNQIVSAGKGRRRPRSLTSSLVRRQAREKLWHLALPVSVAMLDEAAGIEKQIEGQLCDISVEGCRVQIPISIVPNVAISVTIAGLASILGSVRWCQDGTAGVHFSEPLSSAIIEQIADSPAAGLCQA